MLEGAREAGEIQGLIPVLIDRRPTHLQYADDTVIFLEMNMQSIINTKILLNCFGNMSGLKINYQKSEVYVLGL
jgi:hypothetical protein